MSINYKKKFILKGGIFVANVASIAAILAICQTQATEAESADVAESASTEESATPIEATEQVEIATDADSAGGEKPQPKAKQVEEESEPGHTAASIDAESAEQARAEGGANTGDTATHAQEEVAAILNAAKEVEADNAPKPTQEITEAEAAMLAATDASQVESATGAAAAGSPEKGDDSGSTYVSKTGAQESPVAATEVAQSDSAILGAPVDSTKADDTIAAEETAGGQPSAEVAQGETGEAGASEQRKLAAPAKKSQEQKIRDALKQIRDARATLQKLAKLPSLARLEVAEAKLKEAGGKRSTESGKYSAATNRIIDTMKNAGLLSDNAAPGTMANGISPEDAAAIEAIVAADEAANPHKSRQQRLKDAFEVMEARKRQLADREAGQKRQEPNPDRTKMSIAKREEERVRGEHERAMAGKTSLIDRLKRALSRALNNQNAETMAMYRAEYEKLARIDALQAQIAELKQGIGTIAAQANVRTDGHAARTQMLERKLVADKRIIQRAREVERDLIARLDSAQQQLAEMHQAVSGGRKGESGNEQALKRQIRRMQQMLRMQKAKIETMAQAAGNVERGYLAKIDQMKQAEAEAKVRESRRQRQAEVITQQARMRVQATEAQQASAVQSPSGMAATQQPVADAQATATVELAADAQQEAVIQTAAANATTTVAAHPSDAQLVTAQHVPEVTAANLTVESQPAQAHIIKQNGQWIKVDGTSAGETQAQPTATCATSDASCRVDLDAHMSQLTDTAQQPVGTDETAKTARAVEFAVRSIIDAVKRLTGGDASKIDAMMNLIGAGRELPQLTEAVTDVAGGRLRQDIYQKAQLEIARRYLEKRALVGESLVRTHGPGGGQLASWTS